MTKSPLFLLAILACLRGLSPAADLKPNIVFILLDNVGQEWFGCDGSEEACTPNIDRLAATGLRVEHGYTPPICRPSRVALLTGRYPHHTVFRLHHDAALYSGGGLDPKREMLFPRLFRDAGWIMSLIPHDMDGDSDADLLFTDRKGSRRGVFWLENPGPQASRNHAAWQEHIIGAQDREVMFADVADLNGDGLQDVIVAAKPVEVMMFLRQSDGTWKSQSLPLHAENLGDAKAVKAGDLNADGPVDLFFTCENAKGDGEGIVWLEQQKDAPWKQYPLGGPEGVKFDLMQLLEADGDGGLDMFTCEERDQLGVVWYENPHR